MDRVENTAPNCCSSIVSVGKCLLTKPLISNGSCIFTHLAVVAHQRIYMLKHFRRSINIHYFRILYKDRERRSHLKNSRVRYVVNWKVQGYGHLQLHNILPSFVAIGHSREDTQYGNYIRQTQIQVTIQVYPVCFLSTLCILETQHSFQ
jgi:hypothetical protein